MAHGTTVRGVYIPAGDPAPLRSADLDLSPAGAYALLGSVSEIVVLPETTAIIHLPDNGKVLGLTPNPRATRLINYYRPGFADADMVLGDAVLVGYDENGSPADLPDDVLATAIALR